MSLYNTTKSVYAIPDLDGMFTIPAMLGMSERLLLYSLIVSLRPERVLEIGTANGGSAWIMAKAMDYAECGQVVTLDLAPTPIFDDIYPQIQHRVTSLVGDSASLVPTAAKVLGGKFDVAFIDGDHALEGVSRDIKAVLPYMKSGGLLLFHDIYYGGVDQALKTAQHNPAFCDTGVINYNAGVDNQGTIWGGMRLFCYDA